jgi:hypothetical protein
MNLKIKESILRNGKRYNEGDNIELLDDIAKVWIQKGFATKVTKKKSKIEIETKELKVEYLENKDNATDKD